MKLFFSLLVLFISFQFVYAEDNAKEKKDTTVAIRGEKIPAAGYKIYFSEDKKEYLQFSGYMRLYYKPLNVGKLTMPYFRFLVDGGNTDKLSFHSRLDYRHSSFMDTSTNGDDLANTGKATGLSGIYWARAYGSYKLNDVITVDFGRISDQLYRYDVLAGSHVNVDLGFQATIKLIDNMSLKATILYVRPSDVYTKTAAQKLTNTKATVVESEQYVANMRLGHIYKISEDNSLEFGLATGANLVQKADKFVQAIPDIKYSAKTFYILDECLIKWDTAFVASTASNTVESYENYFEVGYTALDPFNVDVFLRTNASSGDLSHDVALEAVYTFSPAVTLVGSAELGDLQNKTKKDMGSRMTYVAFLEYLF